MSAPVEDFRDLGCPVCGDDVDEDWRCIGCGYHPLDDEDCCPDCSCWGDDGDLCEDLVELGPAGKQALG